jgi:hypothetical protein
MEAAAGSGGEEREETGTTLRQRRNAMKSVFIQKTKKLATYQWYRDLAKAHISTMVTTVSEGSVNNLSTGAVSEITTSSRQSRSVMKCVLKMTSS